MSPTRRPTASGYAMAESGGYDVLIVDRMLPKLDGLSLIGGLRAQKNETPGADPVGARPGRRSRQGVARRRRRLSGQALRLLRIAGARRSAGPPPPGAGAETTVYRVADLELDRLKHKAVRAGKEIVLQPREFRLLEYLMRHAGQVVTRTMLLENVWDYHFDPQTNVIDVHMSPSARQDRQGPAKAAAAYGARRRLLDRRERRLKPGTYCRGRAIGAPSPRFTGRRSG